VHLITVGQIAVLGPLLLIGCLLFQGHVLGAASGAATELVGRAYFGYYAFQYIGAQKAHQVRRAMMQGQLGKFVLVAVMFGLLFVSSWKINPIDVFTGYCVSWMLGVYMSARVLDWKFNLRFTG
jgi:F0F1-type ATP synthase assembly protein I